MAPPRGNCHFCHRPVGDQEKAAFPVTGWEVERKEGGANQILGRDRVEDVIAHAECARMHVKSPGGEQTRMEYDLEAEM